MNEKSLLLIGVAKRLGINPDHLYKLIKFESNWNPKARNPISGARGLIQFTNTTARGMGYNDADEIVAIYPSIEEQLQGPVYDYLRPLKPFRGKQDLAMSVFYPKARSWFPYWIFPSNVRKSNPGIIFVRDYVRKVYHDVDYIPIVVLGVIGYIIYKKKGTKNVKQQDHRKKA